jgi:hypothetical protein
MQAKRNLKRYINKTLSQQGLSTDVNLTKLIDQKVAQLENNIRFVCRAASGEKYLAKFSLTSLNHKKVTKGIRSKMNLSNEVRFYRQYGKQNFSNIKIPEFRAGKGRGKAYLIIEYLSDDKYHIFRPDYGYESDGYPDFFAKKLIQGLDEFYEYSKGLDKDKFLTMDFVKTQKWLQSMEAKLNKSLSHRFNLVCEIFNENIAVLQDQECVITHSDILPDTLGYKKDSQKLVLLDFEKVQVSIKAFDLSAFVKGPMHQEWIREKFEPELFNHYKNVEFRKAYMTFKLLRLINSISTLQSGRLDHVFKSFLGEKRFQKLKEPSISNWIEELDKSLQDIQDLM